MGVYKYQINCRPPYCVGKENTSCGKNNICAGYTRVVEQYTTTGGINHCWEGTVSTLLEATPAVSVVL